MQQKKKQAKRVRKVVVKESYSSFSVYEELYNRVVAAIRRGVQSVISGAVWFSQLTIREIMPTSPIVAIEPVRGGDIHMANIFQVRVQTHAERTVNVVANSAEEAQGKVTVTEGETVVEVVDAGEAIL